MDIDYILLKKEKLEKELEPYAEYGFGNEADLRKEIYESIQKRYSYEIIKKADLRDLIGKDYLEDLFFIISVSIDKGFDAFYFLVSREMDRLLDKDEIIDKIHSVAIFLEYLSDSIYQEFSFSYKIADKFYPGTKFPKGKIKLTDSEQKSLITSIREREDFMPEIIDTIEELCGKDNCLLDYYELGDDSFSIFFYIHEKAYNRAVVEIGKWVKRNKIQGLVEYELGNTEFTNN